MAMVKTILVFGITGLTLVACTPIALAACVLRFLGFKKPTAFLLYKIAQAWARFLIILTGCTMKVEGRENIPRKGGLCLVSNHVGIFDIILALGYVGRPFGFIAKKELAFVPGINIWISLLGGLFLDRKRPKNALKTINMGIQRLKSGSGMLIFPEGTRSRGAGLGLFLPGSLRLATQSEASMVPMAITGSFDVFEKNYRVNAVRVSLSFLPPVHPAELPPEDRKQILAGQIHDSIARVLATHPAPMIP